MPEIINDFDNWRRTELGDPILTSTEDAMAYAKLISYNNNECFRMLTLSFECLFWFDYLKSRHCPDRPCMKAIALNCQLYRECLYEIRRIRSEHKNL